MEIATKQDIDKLKTELLHAIEVRNAEKQIPPVILTAKVREILGGVSNGYVTKLRQNKILNPVKVNSTWLWNLDEVLSLLPKSPLNIKA